mmetsp:Transcript_27702/g.88055  ORF Transcript_27702/g.88055 Transcript_27702/m.88055 type:complete len:253 (-) Transcript_27702:3-761(-)
MTSRCWSRGSCSMVWIRLSKAVPSPAKLCVSKILSKLLEISCNWGNGSRPSRNAPTMAKAATGLCTAMLSSSAWAPERRCKSNGAKCWNRLAQALSEAVDAQPHKCDARCPSMATSGEGAQGPGCPAGGVAWDFGCCPWLGMAAPLAGGRRNTSSSFTVVACPERATKSERDAGVKRQRSPSSSRYLSPRSSLLSSGKLIATARCSSSQVRPDRRVRRMSPLKVSLRTIAMQRSCVGRGGDSRCARGWQGAA